MTCIHCNHSCHCSRKCSSCECLNCEHKNALDEFYKYLDQYAAAMINLQKHKD